MQSNLLNWIDFEWPMFTGLSEAIRAEVMMTSELDDIWQRAEFLDPDSVQWR